MSKLAIIKDIVMDVLSDYKEHSAQELREEIQKRGVYLSEGSSAFRTAMYQLRNSDVNLDSRERGVYCMVKQTDSPQLKGFTVLKPSDKTSKRCVYVHEDGKIILNGKLNGEIMSRKIEIRIAEGGEKIALIEEGREYHRFTKSGRTKNLEMVKLVGKKKVSFPICYEIEKHNDIWIGKLRRVKSDVK